jgi:hypothetical protein
MERSTSEVIAISIVRFRHRLDIAFLLLILSFAPGAVDQRPAAADYLIIQNVDQLLVYNKYQQKITSKERGVLVPYIPMKILDAQGTLNDNYTPCMRVEVQNVLFYLIKNDPSTLMGARNLGFHRVYKNVTIVQDTIQLVENSETILLSPNRTHQAPVSRGKKIAGYFQDGDLIYVKVLGGSQNYGWVRFSGKIEAVMRQKQKAGPISYRKISPSIVKRIDKKIFEANLALSKLFIFFNKQKNQKKAIPQWRSISSDQNIAYKLEPDIYARSFSESDQYLTRDLENILLGTPYAVFYTPGRISLRQK